MGLNLNFTRPDGQSINYWKISRLENWFGGYDNGGTNVNVAGYTSQAYREAGAPSIEGNMYTSEYWSGTDLYEYNDLTGVSGVVTGQQREVPLPAGWNPLENGVSGWMQRSDDERSGAYDWLKVCVPFFSGATDEWTVGE
jgi:hypothetical protein|tara:strand:- start:1272 stop:1691 length:420 start_codon:yes stop_codon:yes gene_type:complete